MVGVLVAMQAASGSAAVSHDRAFWRSIVQHDYAPPTAVSSETTTPDPAPREPAPVEPLVRELAGYLASPDPELRDAFGYSILTAWILQQPRVPPDIVRQLMAEWSANLRQDIGSTNTDAVFRRSFSVLMLSVVVAHDNAAAFLDAAEAQALLAAALAYLHDERDLRGYDARKGWMHSAAHTADLLKFLARSRFLAAADQRRLLDAIALKMRESSIVFTDGEDGRFARAILSIVNRTDFDVDSFTDWVTRSTPVPPRTALPDPAVLRARQNVVNLFAKLEILLMLQESEASAPAVPAARDALRAALKTLF
jgi:hypothetical protein